MIRLPDFAAQSGADASPPAAQLQERAQADLLEFNGSGFSDSVASQTGNDWPPSTFQPDHLMDFAVRMVTPMRREFNRAMDVMHFLYDVAYAKEIIALALTSRDARLRGYATFLDIKMFRSHAQGPSRLPMTRPHP